MSRRWLLSLLCLAVLFLSLVQLTRARGELRVDETSSSVFFEKDPAQVLLAVENPSTNNINANVQLELLDPANKSVANTTQVQTIAPGSQKLSLSLPFGFPASDEKKRSQILWYRLHYRLSPQASPAETLADGIVSLSQIAADVFELRVSATEMVREGNRYRVRIQAVHPFTQRRVANVRVDAQVKLYADDDKSTTLAASKLTDNKGQALFDFELPSRFPPFPHNLQPDGGELQVTGRKGAILAQTKGDILVNQLPQILISTDKPLYQPGQVMHLRALLLTPSSRALPNQNTYFKICDPENAVLYRTVVTTSRFGIANTDWSIPENTRLGDYRIWVGIDGGDAETAQDVRISRYELPNFKVNVDLDRKFYLPGQDAKVTVRADYLFGQPVSRGKVRVVRESEREWNYREQKWDLSEDDEQEGETSRDGSFTADLDLSSHHEDLAANEYRRFEDITYAAYFTDPTTNRTEQRRFDVRVTKDPIHVYAVEDFGSSYNRKLPVKFYVSTFYADGSPARAKVNVEFKGDTDISTITTRIATVNTNRFGLATINARLPKDFEHTNSLDLVLSASDSSGRKGSEKQDFYVSDEPLVRVETDKAIYRPGEPINATITASGVDEPLVVDLAGEGGLIRSRRVELRDGRASIVFPYRPEFKNRVTVVAYVEQAQSSGLIGLRTVLYPYNNELNVKVQSSQDTYRPGEDVKLNFSVRAAENRSAESALGVVVLDQAVVERFRTDQEFGAPAYGFDNAIQQFLGLADRVAGVSLRDLQRLDTSQPISPELDLVAAVLLRNSITYYPKFYSGDDFDPDVAKLFGNTIKVQLEPLKKALANRYVNTKEYPSNEADLRNSLSRSGIDFNNTRDPWGMPYRAEFSVEKQNDQLTLFSGGPDKRYGTADDFVVDEMSWPYFRVAGETIDRAIMRYHQRTGKFIRDVATLRQELLTDGLNLDQFYDRWGKPYRLDFDVDWSQFVLKIRSGAAPRAQISAALGDNFNRTKTFPQSDQEWRQALGDLRDSVENLRDPWGHAYYLTYRIQSVYTDRVQLESQANFGEASAIRTNITPITQTLALAVLHSLGPDARLGTSDDFSIATFTGVISEQPRGAVTPVVLNSGVVFSGPNGVVVGVVTDAAGAVIPGVTVKATSSPLGQSYETSSNENGRFGFPALPPGTYELTFDATGFKRSVISQVVVTSNHITEVNASLSPGQVTETVTVTSAAPDMQTQSASVVSSSVKRATDFVRAPGSGHQQISTPRLREYFPETLLWQPSIETDRHGRAQISFKLADNITTWKTVVIGSTEDGRVGATEKEIKAFQPFFVEHDPPRVLTQGDEISLPVVVRNYLSQAQKVELEIKPESWFSLLGPAQKQASVAAGDAKRETFDFRASATVKDGKQRITARAADDHDAIEKPVTVHPDGQELSVAAGDVVDDATALELDVAPGMIPNTIRGEVKFYPNLLAHVVESVEAIMQRPYGCGEQTISSTYPSLLLLRHYKKTGEGFPLSGRAQRYLKDGYSRLLNYRAEDGGFTYWGAGDADVALTAYALQFLIDASEVMTVDEQVVKAAREWLLKRQREDGSWPSPNWNERDRQGPSVVLTAYVSRVLARTESGDSQSLKRALDFLAAASQRIDEPYLLASYALAAAGAKDLAKTPIEKLRSLAHQEGNTTCWTLETNTPFYGWGLAGRVETTALVIQALVKNCNSQAAVCDVDRKLINRGLLFLLKQKDRYGVWYSTQTTVNVLEAMLSLLSNEGANSLPPSSADIVVNGNRVQTIQGTDRFNNPVTADISQFLKAGKNRIEIKRPAGSPAASVQAVANYYVPWPDAQLANHTSTSDLRLQVNFDKTETKIGDQITCRVEAARVGFHGYGMMLAEIGIPPGAEVDRSSLQAARADWTITRYDVLPDRVVLYLWPKAGGITFNFKFRPRFGLTAKTAASTLYDYYNPEANVVVAPSLFQIR